MHYCAIVSQRKGREEMKGLTMRSQGWKKKNCMRYRRENMYVGRTGTTGTLLSV